MNPTEQQTTSWDARPRKPVCASGHLFTPENTKVLANGWRRCRQCLRQRSVRLNAARKEARTQCRRGHAFDHVARNGSRHCLICRRRKWPTCRRGHVWTPETTGWWRGRRFCKVCHRDRALHARRRLVRVPVTPRAESIRPRATATVIASKDGRPVMVKLAEGVRLRIDVHDAFYRGERGRFRQLMLSAHPDKGGTARRFIEARSRYENFLKREAQWYATLGLEPPER